MILYRPIPTWPIPLLALLAAGCTEYDLSSLTGNHGREFLAVDLDNDDGDEGVESADAQPAALVVGNPGETGAVAEIEIWRRGLDEAPLRGEVAAGDVETFELPRWDAEGVFRDWRAFHVQSTVPISVHQINPAFDAGVFSTDASMLIPTPSLDRRYRAFCWPRWEAEGPGADWGQWDTLTVVATGTGATLTVVTTEDTAAGDGVPAIARGVPTEVELEPYQVLQLASASGDEPTDLTGSLVVSTEPVAVFSGNECARVPAGHCCCDHLEEQLLPVSTWGTHHVVARFERGGSAPDVWRVMADEADTVVETIPPLPEVFPVTLGAGQFLEFEHDGDLRILSTGPVAVGQYMTGAYYLGERDGDPSLVVVPPEAQFAEQYQLLVPEGWDENRVYVTAPAGTHVEVDGERVVRWSDIDEQWQTAHVRLDAGPHRIEADHPVGAVVYGIDETVSYAYPAGAKLQPVPANP